MRRTYVHLGLTCVWKASFWRSSGDGCTGPIRPMIEGARDENASQEVCMGASSIGCLVYPAYAEVTVQRVNRLEYCIEVLDRNCEPNAPIFGSQQCAHGTIMGHHHILYYSRILQAPSANMLLSPSRCLPRIRHRMLCSSVVPQAVLENASCSTIYPNRIR